MRICIFFFFLIFYSHCICIYIYDAIFCSEIFTLYISLMKLNMLCSCVVARDIPFFVSISYMLSHPNWRRLYLEGTFNYRGKACS